MTVSNKQGKPSGEFWRDALMRKVEDQEKRLRNIEKLNPNKLIAMQQAYNRQMQQNIKTISVDITELNGVKDELKDFSEINEQIRTTLSAVQEGQSSIRTKLLNQEGDIGKIKDSNNKIIIDNTVMNDRINQQKIAMENYSIALSQKEKTVKFYFYGFFIIQVFIVLFYTIPIVLKWLQNS